MDICEGGLRIRTGSGPNESQMTPFQSIAVWSAVKFVLNQSEGTAAFLPLITDPENLDKKTLFQPIRFVSNTIFEQFPNDWCDIKNVIFLVHLIDDAFLLVPIHQFLLLSCDQNNQTNNLSS